MTHAPIAIGKLPALSHYKPTNSNTPKSKNKKKHNIHNHKHTTMNITQLLSSYRPATQRILDYLNTEDRRKLFFTSTHIQQILAPYSEMQEFATTAEQLHITFYFPRLTHGKHETKYAKRRNVINIQANALALKIPCQQCGTLFYNANYETEFKQCANHKQYSYSKGQMKIKHRGQDLFGKFWTSKEPYEAVGTARALCYCNTCNKFMYYNSFKTGFKLKTCLNCLQHDHDHDRLYNIKTIQDINIDNKVGFFIPPVVYRLIQV